LLNPVIVHVDPDDEHDREDPPALAVAVKSRIGSTEPPEFHETTSDASDSRIDVMTGVFGSGATVNVSTPRVPSNPAASVRP
jgi:hypothetical protein